MTKFFDKEKLDCKACAANNFLNKYVKELSDSDSDSEKSKKKYSFFKLIKKIWSFIKKIIKLKKNILIICVLFLLVSINSKKIIKKYLSTLIIHFINKVKILKEKFFQLK